MDVRPYCSINILKKTGKNRGITDRGEETVRSGWGISGERPQENMLPTGM